MQEKISIDRELCVNYRFTRMKCRLCRDACPECKDESGDLGKNCTSCGLCISACPAEAVMGENFSSIEMEKLLAESGPAYLSCRHRQQDSSWPCLGFLDARILLSLAFTTAANSTVVIDDVGCSSCKPAVAVRLAELIEQVNAILKPQGKSIVTTGSGYKAALRPKVVSRRQFFSHLFGATVSTVREVVAPGLFTFQRLPRSDWFKQHARPHLEACASSRQRVFRTVTVSPLCDGCGVCAGICPQKALAAQINGNVLELVHDPLACTQCGVCIAHCPQNALQPGDTETLDRQRAASVELPACRDCGKHFQPVGGYTVCMDCLLKNKIQTIW